MNWPTPESNRFLVCVGGEGGRGEREGAVPGGSAGSLGRAVFSRRCRSHLGVSPAAGWDLLGQTDGRGVE